MFEKANESNGEWGGAPEDDAVMLSESKREFPVFDNATLATFTGPVSRNRISVAGALNPSSVLFPVNPVTPAS